MGIMKKTKWTEIMENHSDKIIEKMIQAKRESEGTMQGWSVGVEMDGDGDVWTTGLMSQGSQSASSFNGETYNVTAIQSWKAEYDEAEFFTTEDDDTLEKEYKKYKEEEGSSVRTFMLDKHPNKLVPIHDGDLRHLVAL